MNARHRKMPRHAGNPMMQDVLTVLNRFEAMLNCFEAMFDAKMISIDAKLAALQASQDSLGKELKEDIKGSESRLKSDIERLSDRVGRQEHKLSAIGNPRVSASCPRIISRRSSRLRLRAFLGN